MAGGGEARGDFALMQLMSMQPPTVEPGATGVFEPGDAHIASPAGAPVSSTEVGKVVKASFCQRAGGGRFRRGLC